MDLKYRETELRVKISEMMAHLWMADYESSPGIVYNVIYGHNQDKNTVVYALHFTKDGKFVSVPKHQVNYDKNQYGYFNTSETISKLLNSDKCICIPTSDTTYFVFGIKTDFIFDISTAGENSRQYRIDLYTDDINGFLEDMSDAFIFLKNKDDKPEFGILSVTGDGSLYTSYYDLKVKYDIDIKKHYNDDLPYDKIMNCIKDDSKSDLILFYGEPGTGKSSVIKKLIQDYDDGDFIFCDSRILASISSGSFVSWMTENAGAVLILEDCEKILASRDIADSGIMSTILNITDGVIADVLGIKIICTFNTSISNIDKALLRKGRLSVKYCFGKLAADKCKAINPSVTTDTSLADLFNIEENDYSKKPVKKNWILVI